MAALLPVAIAGAAAWYLFGTASDWKRSATTAHATATAPSERLTFNAPYGHIRDRMFAADGMHFESVIESEDVNGARIFLVNYGNDQLVTQYHDPRVLA